MMSEKTLDIIEQEYVISKGIKRIFALGCFKIDLCCLYSRILEE